jgi:dihydroxyacid dehydratase/phosphogluconate dehydratase
MTTPTRPIPRSQRLRVVNHQGDALRLGMKGTEEDLGKPQVLVDSCYGMGHPGTFHFRELVEEVSNGTHEAGGKPAVFAVSEICDGVVQASGGMSYSLVSRDIMAAMVEIRALGHPHDGMVLISGSDKSVPAHLVAIARCDLPVIHLPGGTQLNACTWPSRRAGSPAPAWTTSRRNRPNGGTGSQRTRSSVWTTWSSHHMRRTTPKRRSTRSATLPRMR